MKRNRFSRFIIFAMTTFIFLVSLLFFISVNPNLRQQASSLPSAGLSRLSMIVRGPSQALANFSSQLNDILNTYQQNQVLKSRILELENQDSLIKQLEAENQDLRSTLKIEETFSGAKRINSQVISRSSVAWLEALTVDKGQDDGVTDKMLLVSEKGLLGTISQINSDTTEIELLTNTASNQAVPVKIKTDKETIYGIMQGYDAQTQLARVTQLNSQADIPVGSSVATSGLDGKSMPDVPVGKVESIAYGINQSKIVSIRLAADFGALSQVSLVGRP